MNDSKKIKQEIKREDSKESKKFIGWMLLSVLVGMIFAILVRVFGDGRGEDIRHIGMWFMFQICPFASLVLSLLLFLWGGSSIRACRKKFANWDGENEAQMSWIEEKLGKVMWLSNMNLVLGYFFFSASIGGIEGVDFDPYNVFHASKIFVCLGGLFFTLAVVVILQKNIVNFEKEMNPEKKGSFYDMKFADKWMDSCDEWEKMIAYKSSFKAFKVSSTACVIIWLILLLGFGIGLWGIMPSIVVTIVWGIMLSTYCAESIRLEKLNK